MDFPPPRFCISDTMALSDRPPPKIFAITASAWEAESPDDSNAFLMPLSAT